MSQRLEIWTIAEKWMTMNENVEKKKRLEKNEENEKAQNKKLNYLLDQLETLNFDHRSEVDDNE